MCRRIRPVILRMQTTPNCFFGIPGVVTVDIAIPVIMEAGLYSPLPAVAVLSNEESSNNILQIFQRGDVESTRSGHFRVIVGQSGNAG